MSILILGGRGNLGSQLTLVFSKVQETFSWDRNDLDFLDFPLLEEKIRALNPELIINAAAYNNVDRCEETEERQIAMRLNRDLPGVLAELALAIDAVLIHYSTDYVFGGTVVRPEFDETDTPNPVNRYGESKFQGEREILQRAERGLKYYLIRTSKLFGPRGDSPQAKPSFFDIMLDLAENKRDKQGEISVVKEEVSCFTYTPDLAVATQHLWEIKAPFGLYHLINEGAATWYEAAAELFSLKKIKTALRPVRSEDLSRPARRPKFSILRNTKARKLRSWKVALKDYLEINN